MPRAVVVRFGKAENAEMFCRFVAGKDEFEPGELEHLLLEKSRLEAVIAVPASKAGCNCDIKEPTGGRRRRRSASKSRGGGWVRSEHFGWWVHTACSRPSKVVIKAWISGMLNGANDLLPEILGEGPPISAHNRWQLDTGLPSSAPDEKHFDGGPNAAPVSPRRSRRARH